MCGRTVCHLAPGDIQSACRYKDKNGKTQKPDWKEATNGKKYFPSYNIAPGAYTPILLSSAHFDNNGSDATSRVIQPMLWGLIPSWHKGSAANKPYETNNCRAESMLEKQTYKAPLQKGRRCVILAEGFYEWKRDKTVKQPYLIYFPKKHTHNTSTDFKHEDGRVTDSNSEASVGKEDKNSDHDSCDIKDTLKSSTVKCDIKQELVETDKVESRDVKVKTEPASDIELIGKEERDGSPQSNGVDIGNADKEDTNPPLLTMAGVFDVWQPPDGSEPFYSYSVITVESSSALDWLHHRMPAILSSNEEIEEWLNFGEVPLTKAVKLIQPSKNIELHPVSSFVNNSRNNSPECIEKIDPSKPKRSASSNMMMAWLSKGSSPGKMEPGTINSKKDSKRKAANSIMTGWLSKGKSPIKDESPDSKRLKSS